MPPTSVLRRRRHKRPSGPNRLLVVARIVVESCRTLFLKLAVDVILISAVHSHARIAPGIAGRRIRFRSFLAGHNRKLL